MSSSPQELGPGEEIGAARRGLFQAYRTAGSRVAIEATGSSMRPLIDPGDMILVEFGSRDPEIGEIALFGQGELTVAHRVVCKPAGRDGLIRTKGDGSLTLDDPLRARDVLGIVVGMTRAPDDGPPILVGRFRPSPALARVSRTIAHFEGALWRLPELPRKRARRVLALVNRIVLVVMVPVLAGPRKVSASASFED